MKFINQGTLYMYVIVKNSSSIVVIYNVKHEFRVCTVYFILRGSSDDKLVLIIVEFCL